MTATQTIGARLLDIYEVDREQALELARSLDDEQGRLLLAMAWAEDVFMEIDIIADRQPGFLARIAYRSLPHEDLPPGLLGFLAAGAYFWRSRAYHLRAELSVMGDR